MMKSSRMLVALFLMLLAGVDLLAGQGRLPPDLDRYIEEVRAEWRVVGLAVAVVKDDSVVYARGFGVRRLGEAGPVDEHSLFAIGSNTKAFTAAGVGILVGEGRMAWGDRVVDHLPVFSLFDPYVTREIRVRDLLCHRSGLPAYGGDPVWYASDFGRDEVLRRVRYLEPSSSFRSQFAYQNIMFLAAGEVTEAVAGVSWDEWIATRILRPLGMTRSNTSHDDLATASNVAMPHAMVNDEVMAIPYRDIDNVAPAGSIHSSAQDMTRWLRVLLGEGTIDGRRVLPEVVVAEMLVPHTLRPVDTLSARLFPSTHFSAYGLGVGLRDYGGRMVVAHTGGIDGMLSMVTLVPEEELGIVVLTNTSPNTAYNPIVYHILDSYLGLPAQDWPAVYQELDRRTAEQSAAARERQERSRMQDTSPSLALGAYAGTYDHPLFGRVTIAEEGGGLVLRRHSAYVGDLAHWHFDTFRVTYRDPVLGSGMVTFRLNASGRVGALEAAGLGVFDRVPEGGAGR